MITRLNGLLLAFATTVLAVGAAQATPPIIVPAPAFDFTDTTCGFPVQIHYTSNGETAKIFSDGKVIITGPLAATFSANGKSLTLNIAGPAIISPSGAVSGYGVGYGPIELPSGEITLGLIAGQVDLAFTNGRAVLLHGHVLLDICAALSP